MHNFWLLLLFSPGFGAWAQQREIGGLGGGGFLTSATLRGGPAAATAGFSPGYAAGVILGQDLYRHWSGEIRYLYERRDARLGNRGTISEFAAQTHTVHYDVVLHARPRTARIRPYLAAGGGVKLFRGSGAEVAYRPLMEYAYLTRTTELKPVLVVGAGVKFVFAGHLIARIDLRDHITGFPHKVIAPAPGITAGGIFHDLVPAAGLSWTF